MLLVYICIVVVARFTFFPFSKVNGEIQPLIFESSKAFPFWINWIPFVNLFDYPEMRNILINVIGNTAMFIPLGIVWTSVYKGLDTHWKVISAGVGVSLCIEILQLPFYDRVSDVEDFFKSQTSNFIFHATPSLSDFTNIITDFALRCNHALAMINMKSNIWRFCYVHCSCHYLSSG
ncbi:MAG: VanZ family protein [Ruminococcaceae bacterium]|nr:VanZ family protein [Oscillospiraceae bacterium]